MCYAKQMASNRAAPIQLRLDAAPAPEPPAVRPVSSRTGLRRMTVMPNEAAALLGVSRDFFDEHVRPELRIIRRGGKTILIPVRELERWIDESAVRLGGRCLVRFPRFVRCFHVVCLEGREELPCRLPRLTSQSASRIATLNTPPRARVALPTSLKVAAPSS